MRLLRVIEEGCGLCNAMSKISSVYTHLGDMYDSGSTNGNGMRHNASRISKNQLERQA